jgi:quinol monooxygenase YgiN
MSTEISTIGRFHAREGCEEAMEQAIRKGWTPSRAEPGCVCVEWFRGIRDPRLFFVHSRWVDQAAFDIHAGMPHTVTFIEEAEALMDHPLDVTRLLALETISES